TSCCCFRSPDTTSRSRVKMTSPHSTPSAVVTAVSLKAVYAAYPPESAANPAVKQMRAPHSAYVCTSVRQLAPCTSSGVPPEHITKNRLRRFGAEPATGRDSADGGGVRSEAPRLVKADLVSDSASISASATFGHSA